MSHIKDPLAEVFDSIADRIRTRIKEHPEIKISEDGSPLCGEEHAKKLNAQAAQIRMRI